MKSIHYIATVVSFYRQVLDGKYFSKEQGLEILNRVPNRGFSSGFMKGYIDENDYELEDSASVSDTIFVGNVLEEKINGRSVLEVRNRIKAGENLELFSPDGTLKTVRMTDPLITREGTQCSFANHSQFILLEQNLESYTILRRVGENKVS